MDGDPQSVGVKAQATVVFWGGEQFPGHGDGFALEVVAKAEVSVHLEERAVAGGLAHFFDVGGAHALLHAGGAWEGGGFAAGEVWDELHHAGDVEEDGGVG